MKIAIFYGTRPEYIKLLPIMKELDKEDIKYRLIKIGQHSSLIDGCKYDEFWPISDTIGNRLDTIISDVVGYKLGPLGS